EQLGSSLLEINEVIGVVQETHPVGLGITDSDGDFTAQHGATTGNHLCHFAKSLGCLAKYSYAIRPYAPMTSNLLAEYFANLPHALKCQICRMYSIFIRPSNYPLIDPAS